MTIPFFANLSLTFANPWWLLLLTLIPVIWVIGRKSGRALGQRRWWLANLLRCGLVALLVGALAGIQLQRQGIGTTVIYLVDRSLSIPNERLPDVIEYVRQTSEQGKFGSGDQSAVIVFGGTAAVEVPPVPQQVTLPASLESHIVLDHTDLAGALDLARAIFPVETARRIVVISDGNETLGDAMRVAGSLREQGIGIDVVPVRLAQRHDVRVDKVSTPPQVNEDSPFRVSVVLDNDAPPQAGIPPAEGQLTIFRNQGGRESVMVQQHVSVPPGRRAFTFDERIANSGVFEYRARFIPDRPADDVQPLNNEARSFSFVNGRGHVLMIVDDAHPEEFSSLIEILRKQGLTVTVTPSNIAQYSLADLQSFDVVVLADVARVSGEEAETLATFSEQQLIDLAENTRVLGCGLVMLGGKQSFGAGGWSKTPIEEAMPIEFHVNNSKVVPRGALALVIDNSGSMSGEKIAICKAAAQEAVKVLGDVDYIGVVGFNGASFEVVPMQSAKRRNRIINQISKLGSGGGTNMYPGMEDGLRMLERATEASIKHMIVLTDGQTQPGRFRELVQQISDRGITISTVAVGNDADQRLLQDIATGGNGKFYRVNSPKAVPRIFIKEALRVTRPLIYEDPAGFSPQVTYPHEMLTGVDVDLPPITGFVLTTPKDSPLVELSIMSPVPQGNTNPVLASWNYGLGRSVAWTTDAGDRWTGAWTDWAGKEKLFTQMIRWAMRSTRGDDRFNLATLLQDGQVDVVLTAIDQETGFLNSLAPQVLVAGPSNSNQSVTLRQVAPGRYEGSFPTTEAGTYLLAALPGLDISPLRAGVSVGYSDEFRAQGTNAALLEQLAQLAPEGGAPGQVIELPALNNPQPLPANAGPFRPDLPLPTSEQAVWFLAVFACACLLLVDVLNRRLAWNFAWLGTGSHWLLLRFRRVQPAEAANPQLERLRSRKLEATEAWKSQAANARFDPERQDESAGQRDAVGATSEQADQQPRTRPASPSPTAGLEPDQELGYTERLLKIKKQFRGTPNG